MSPELLGWYEQQGFESALARDCTPSASPQDDESQQQLPSFQFMRAPVSALKSKQAVDSPGLGKAVRVKTPAK